MKNKIIAIISIFLIFFLQAGLVSPAAAKIIKVSFTINQRGHIDMEKFEVKEGEFKNPAAMPALYSLQIKNKKGEIIEKTTFAPAFFVLSGNKLTKINQTAISKEFLYKGGEWKFLEVHKEDKLLFQADVHEKFCEETGLCSKSIERMIYAIPIVILLSLLAYLFFRKGRKN